MTKTHFLRTGLAFAAALSVAGCAGGSFTGPVEVTRFVAAQTDALGKGTIAVRFASEIENEAALDAFRGAISDELSLQGYTVIANEEVAGQIATVDTSRNPLAAPDDGPPVSVGVGGGTGSFGSGLGVGLGINLGGSRDRYPRVMSELSVAIMNNSKEGAQQNLWEGRAQFPTSVNSPYAPVAVNARTLATALFKDFPQGDGQTVSLKASDLVEPE
ncbi:MAG: hypothetical protein HRT64_01665 [Erythrobacter sp.]|nr:hypothetical protein [Erythrobacter sp.]